MDIIVLIVLLIPVVLTIWNIFTAIVFLTKKKETRDGKEMEIVGILTGAFCFNFIVRSSKFASWVGLELPRMINSNSLSIILTLSMVAIAGYFLVRFIPAEKQPPVVSVIGIAAIYLGIGVCALWCLLTYNNIDNFFLVLYPANLIVLFLKTIYILVYQKNILVQSQTASLKSKGLSAFLNKTANPPWVNILFVIPLYGSIVAMSLYCIIVVILNLYTYY